MKHLSFFLCLWASVATSFAQIPNCNAPTPLNEQFRVMIQNLNRSQIPTGILYESVYPWAEIESYDGSDDTDTSNYEHFMQAYSELYYSKFNNNANIHPTDLETAVNNFHPDKEYHHAFGIIDYDYNIIDSNAVTNNLLSVTNNQLFDVADRTQSPYLTRNVKIGSILLADNSGELSPGTHYLHFSPSFIFSNTGFSLNDVQNLKIYINGNLVYDQVVSGLTNVIIPITLDILIAPVVITAVISLAIPYIIYKTIFKKKEKFPLTNCGGQDAIVVTGYTFDGGYGKPAYGAKGKANIFYADANCATKRITKPIIFVDGFDPTNAQHGAELWGKYINRPFKDGNFEDVFLGTELRRMGYDVITFDQEDEGLNRGGGGFMENNALALAKFLEVLYTLHGSTIEDDYVIVGASMGGLVARYALTWMEHNNTPHHTRLFVSFDSPQLGAQIPVGVQQFIDVISQYGGLKGLGAVQNAAVHQTDAAKQLLVHHSSAESETIQSNAYRNIFLNNLNTIGNWPVLCRKIAIVDGNRNGVLKSTTPVPTPSGFEPLYSCGYELDFGIKKRLRKNCSSPSCFKTRSQSFTQTSGTRCKSLDFTVNNNTNLLKLIFGGGQFSNQSLYTQNQNNGSYDLAPGARFGVDPLNIIDNWVKGFAFIVTGHLKVDNNLIPNTNFIPTVSSVAYTFPNNEPFSVYKNFDGITLSKCAGTTPFDTVYAPMQDLNHVQINEEIANWFRSEIYFPKAISSCVNPNDCPEYLTLNSAVPNGESQLKKAQKAIFIEQGFKADGVNESVIFKAAIGCEQMLMPDRQTFPKLNVANSCSQPFEFDQPKNYKMCDNGFTTFHVFAHNIDINTYAEFSTDGTNYFKANILDYGYEITLPNNANPQVFFARSAYNRSNVIGGYLAFCN